jgi:Ca-activated chloride channel family protein
MRMTRVFIVLSAIFYSLLTFANAGLMDFKTIEKAKEAYEAKEYGKSATLLNDIDKNSPQKQYDLGNAYYKSKQYDKAIEAYQRAEGVDEASRLHNLGNSYFKKGDFKNPVNGHEA